MDFPGSDGAANIKEEDSNAMFSWSSDVPRLIEISDDELDSVLPDIPHRPERATATIKEEDSDVQFLWSSDMPRLIEISDEEQEAAVSNIPEYLEKASSPTNAANVVLPQVLKLGKSVLQTQKPRPKFTAEQISKMKQFQKVLAERATGKRMPSTPVTGDADGIWSKCPGPAQGANESQRNDPRNSGNENERAGSLEMIEIDEDPATVFAEKKKAFKVKRRAGTNSYEDDIMFKKAENAETDRLRRLKEDYDRACGNMDGGDMDGDSEDQSLFVSQLPDVSSCRKRPFASIIDDDGESDMANETIGTKSGKRQVLAPPNKRSLLQETEQDLEESMMVGIEKELERYNRKEKATKDKTTRKESGYDTLEKQKSKKGKRGRPRNADKAESHKSKEKATNGKAPKSTRGRPKEPNLANLHSLFSSNVYGDANANLHQAPLPVVSEKNNKGAMLRELILALPVEDHVAAMTDKQHILQATKTLGFRKVRADGTGKWKFIGMNTALYNHQVLGAARMREIETRTDRPRGGILADEMGFGKTLMMIATILANPSPTGDSRKATLIVATAALVSQWKEEIEKHVQKGVLGLVARHHAGFRIDAVDPIAFMQSASIILTTYTEVLKSYPRCEPPPELISHEAKKAWWRNEWQEKRGILHKVHWYRVVLDEAHTIKNHEALISLACQGLMTRHRWAMTGTPCQNSVDELFSYLRFLRVPLIGSYNTFKTNFCDPDNKMATDRLHSVLRLIMIRRTHIDRIYGAPLIVMPETHERTISVTFNRVERIIYDFISKRFAKRINSYSKMGTLEQHCGRVLVLLLCLRQLTSHIFLVQDTFEDLAEYEEVENLMNITASEVTADDNDGRDMLAQMRKLFEEKRNLPPSTQDAETGPDTSVESDEEGPVEQSEGLVFKFRKFLRGLAKSAKWTDIESRSTCHKCLLRPDDPYITSCLHIYCKECLNSMIYEAAQINEDQAACLECGQCFSESRPCDGLKELQSEDLVSTLLQEKTRTTRRRKSSDHCTRWIDMEGGQVLPSSKLAALVAQIEKWLKDDPTCKTIVFTQFRMLIKIIARLCAQKKWKCCTYHGEMPHASRDKALQDFRDSDTAVMIASLKCGGVGLNLTAASRVIYIDLWWNSSVEQQAFCRVFRIGQVSETYITRFVVKDTVDERIQSLQKSKETLIAAAMGDNGKRESKLTVRELMRLFGPVQEDEDHRPFIIVDEEDEAEEDAAPVVEG